MSESTSDWSGWGEAALANMLGLVTDPQKIKQILQLMPDNMVTLQNVLAVLGGSRVASIAFDIPNVSVNSGTFSAVRTAIVTGRIQVFTMPESDPDHAISDGVYVSNGNYMKIAANKAQPAMRKSIVVHESIHAAHDIARSSQLLVRESEMASYIAQAMYIRCYHPTAVQRPNELRPTRFIAPGAPGETEAKEAEKILSAAWDCAVRITGGQKTLSAADPELAALEKAITTSFLYSGNHGDHIFADGV